MIGKANHVKWTKDDILKHVEEMEYLTWSEFMNGSYGAYKAALRLGVTAELLGLKTTRVFSNRHKCVSKSVED